MLEPKLYIVSTPIGNMGDITVRALETLKAVDTILSEDTREADKILKKYSFSKPQISYRDQNHVRVFDIIKGLIESGKSVALVSDSGTPLVSDPGFKLVRDLLAAGIDVEAVPGPSAVVTALTVSGLPTDKFYFFGFLPKTDNQREKTFESLSDLDATLIFYESPFRILNTLVCAHKVFGDRKSCICNDLTKMHEEVVRGKISDILKNYENKKPRGEFVFLVAKKGF